MRVVLVFLPTQARLYSPLLNGIRRRIGSQFEIQTVDYDVCDNNLKELLRFWNPSGCIVIGAEGLRNLTPCKFGMIPLIYIDRTPMTRGNCLDVIQDYREQGNIAARNLLSNNVDNYAYVGNRQPTHWSDLRGKAFVSAIQSQGRTCHVFDKRISECDRPKLLQKWMLSLPKPIGLFAANDRTAFEVLNICAKNKIRIPEDVSLLGVDNVEDICESSSPTLSSIHYDSEQGGYLGADLLLERLSNPYLRHAIRTYPTLGVIQRASTRRSYGNGHTLTRIMNFIQARACNDLSVEDVAAEMGCSRRMAEIRFRSATGTTIKSSITSERLKRAMVLLRGINIPMYEIAKRCGYKSDTALRIAFKKHYGTSLSEERQKAALALNHRHIDTPCP